MPNKKQKLNDPARTGANLCPCGTHLDYLSCCGRFHSGNGKVHASNAETLMRSRYSAFALGLNEYLLATWHPDTRPTDLELEPNRRWLGLEVKHHIQQDDNHAIVEFVARSKLQGRADRLHEMSRFVREAGQWFYVDGDLK